jgi:hypothetical protein
MHQA